jgi:hypothetical protein
MECMTGRMVVPQRGTRFAGVVGMADARVRRVKRVEVREANVSILSG